MPDPRSPRPPSRRVLPAWPAAVVAAALLAGCGAGDETPTDPGTVTVTAPSPDGPDAGSRSTPQETATSDVTGRNHDAGAIVDVREVGGRQVVVLDRWTVVGLDDAALAADGAPVVAHAEERFTNQNDTSTYDVPVAPGVLVVLNECVPADDPAAPPGIASSQSTLDELLATPDLDQTPLLLTYDDGELVQVDTDAAC